MYRDSAGKITATSGKGRQPVTVVSFPDISEGKRDLTMPQVRPLEGEEEKGVDDREARHVEMVPVPSQGKGGGIEHWCRKCASRQSPRWRTGPDGFGTLCALCFTRYLQMRLVLFRDVEGRLSAVANPGWEPVTITGFKKSKREQKRDLTAPIVRVMSAEEVAKSADTCLEHVPPPESDKHSPQPSESRISPSYSVADGLEEITAVETTVDRGMQGGTGTDTNGRLHDVVENFEVSKSIEAATSKWKTDEAHLEPQSNEVGRMFPGAFSVKAACKTEGGVILVRRFTVEMGASFHHFQKQLQDLFKIEKPLGVTYEDDEGDDVTVSSSIELSVMLVIAEEKDISPVRVTVMPKG